MAEKKITDLGTLDATPAGGDYVPVVDVDDAAQSAAGSTKKITVTNLLGSAVTGVTAGTNLTGGGSGGVLTVNLDTTIAGLTSVTSTTLVGALTGNADTATALETARNIAGVSFDGSANIDIEGTGIKSTGEDGGTKFLREDGTGGCSWVVASGTGTVTSVAVAGTDGIDVDSGSPIATSGTITLGLSGIANAALTNSSVSYGGVSVALGASDATPAFDLSDATAYVGDSSLITTGTVTSGTWGTGAIIAGPTMTLGSDAEGDVYYRNSLGILTRLGVASNADVLTLASGVPSWATPTTGTVTSVGTTGTVNGLTLTGTVTGSGNLTLGGTLPVEIGIACSDETTTLETGNNKATLMIPEAMTLTEVKASLSGADTEGSGVDIDVRYHETDPTNAGATVFSGGDLNIADSAFYGTDSSLAVTLLAENSFIMVDINTTDDATGLKIWLIGTK